MKVANNCVVAIHYTLTNDDGVELDSSAGQDPLVYLHGAGNIIPGLETALEGRTEGEDVQVTLQPEEAYGEFNPDLVQMVPHEAFEGIDDVQVGMQFQASGPNGEQLRVTVQELLNDGVLVNANHPLAGQVLNFAVNIADVREATAEEVEHGHAHGEGQAH